ncbi:MAG: methyltransferase domain-containing protein [Candidatus Accumulibacter meliphilus]|jgi:SAM-dependent methyltransferase|uniref:Methyltransferase domain-containing protein n=1 Tax=Candidatus Accumulibacter meliphilus TaxID=2211374 RepID=A0A369XP49_9PROT|nr:MAG: methyltransferase domain-containing protein [Candidatus Accumulibacter meliphilus]
MKEATTLEPRNCFLCGSSNLVSVNYLRLNSDSFKRNLAYFLPRFVAEFLSNASDRFSTAYHPVSVNKKYFDRTAVFCLNCLTGSCQPVFEKDVLDNYYRDFYWLNRDAGDGQHVAHDDRPNDRQLSLSRERIAWIKLYLHKFDSVIDFGAGDCAAAYIFSREENVNAATVVDPSMRASVFAEKYRLGYSTDLAEAPIVDMIYSAHSIEHVHDFRVVMTDLVAKVRPGGHIFIETPNIGDLDVFSRLPHTPHTFMLSQSSFHFLESAFPVSIVAMESCGPLWRRNKKQIVSDERADLRVLLRKAGDA